MLTKTIVLMYIVVLSLLEPISYLVSVAGCNSQNSHSDASPLLMIDRLSLCEMVVHSFVGTTHLPTWWCWCEP